MLVCVLNSSWTGKLLCKLLYVLPFTILPFSAAHSFTLGGCGGFSFYLPIPIAIAHCSVFDWFPPPPPPLSPFCVGTLHSTLHFFPSSQPFASTKFSGGGERCGKCTHNLIEPIIVALIQSGSWQQQHCYAHDTHQPSLPFA